MDNSVESTAKALYLLSNGSGPSKAEPEIKFGNKRYTFIEDEPLPENTQVLDSANGGDTKSVYRLGDDRVIALSAGAKTLTSEADAESLAQNWHEGIEKEVDLSTRFSDMELHTLPTSIETLHVGEHTLPVLVMPDFKSLVKKGMQIRDIKNSDSSYGHTMLLGSEENAKNPEYLKNIMEPLAEDCITLMSHEVTLGGDAMNLVITDTDETPTHDRNQPGLITDRRQKAHFFFTDLAENVGTDNLRTPDGKPDENKVRKAAEKYAQRAYDVLIKAINKEEKDVIFPGKISKQIQFFSNDGSIDKAFEKIKPKLVDEICTGVLHNLSRPPVDLPGNGRPRLIEAALLDQHKGR